MSFVTSTDCIWIFALSLHYREGIKGGVSGRLQLVSSLPEHSGSRGVICPLLRLAVCPYVVRGAASAFSRGCVNKTTLLPIATDLSVQPAAGWESNLPPFFLFFLHKLLVQAYWDSPYSKQLSLLVGVVSSHADCAIFVRRTICWRGSPSLACSTNNARSSGDSAFRKLNLLKRST